MTTVIDGHRISEILLEEVQTTLRELPFDFRPRLLSVHFGQEASVCSYLRQQQKAAEKVGITVEEMQLSADIEETTLLSHLQAWNQNEEYNGILLHSPMPDQLDESHCRRNICLEKDVEGGHPFHLGSLLSNRETVVPCTARAVIEVLNRISYDWKGQEATVVGHSEMVGKPIALLLLQGQDQAATTTVCHAGTDDVAKFTRSSDIVISAVGKSGIIDGSMVKEGAVVIDVGISVGNGEDRQKEQNILGDVEQSSVRGKASWITPVPGGVGPVTVGMLMKNMIRCVKRQL